MKNILYIEDDQIDLKNCQILSSQIQDLVLTTTSNFDDAFDIINQQHFDFIISDQKLGIDSFHEVWHQFLGMPYFILSNSPNEQLNSLLQPPLALFQKPILKEHLQQMVNLYESTAAKPNLSYAEKITDNDPSLLTEMVNILKKQFENGIEKIPYLYGNDNRDELIQVVHKLIGKFSVLSMGESFSFFNRMEKCLRDNLELNQFAYKRLVTDLEKGLIFINYYIKQHELHNN